MKPAERTDILSDPFVRHFLGTALQDCQIHENEEAYQEEREARDCGTVYELPADILEWARSECNAFRAAHGALMVDWPEALAGSDFYLSSVGHGAGFFDRDYPNARALQDAVGFGTPWYGEGFYFGDDGKVYWA